MVFSKGTPGLRGLWSNQGPMLGGESQAPYPSSPDQGSNTKYKALPHLLGHLPNEES